MAAITFSRDRPIDTQVNSGPSPIKLNVSFRAQLDGGTLTIDNSLAAVDRLLSTSKADAIARMLTAEQPHARYKHERAADESFCVHAHKILWSFGESLSDGE